MTPKHRYVDMASLTIEWSTSIAQTFLKGITSKASLNLWYSVVKLSNLQLPHPAAAPLTKPITAAPAAPTTCIDVSDFAAQSGAINDIGKIGVIN
ncbi:hypothetical protein [Chitinibacter sp. S2-10]|uniref:hypothetical protein n=1 Tax=Chitinibacter sp. S2-10 TaxID=3373597 RepID=UPI0039776E97